MLANETISIAAGKGIPISKNDLSARKANKNEASHFLTQGNQQANIVLFLCVMVEQISNTLIIPLLPFYAQRFNASPVATTLVFSAFALTSFFCAPIWGALSDRVGRRPMLLASIAGSSIACFCFGLVNSLPLLFVCNALAGIAAGSSTISSAYITDTTIHEKRAQRIGFLNAAFGLGFCLGPIIGGILVGSKTDPNYFLPATVAAGIGSVAFFAAFFALPESRHNISTGCSGSASHSSDAIPSPILDLQFIQQTFASPLSRTLLVTLFLKSFAVAGIQGILGLWVAHVVGWGAQQVSFIYAIWAITAIIVQLGGIGYAVQRIGEANLFIVGLLTYGIGLSVIPAVNQYSGGNPLYLLIVMLLACTGFSVCSSVFSSLLSQSTPAINQGKVMGLATSTSALAGMIAPVFAGYTFAHWGPSWPFWTGPILIGVTMLMSWPSLTRTHIAMKNVQQRVQNVQQLFTMLDYDQNGLIELKDFEQSLTDMARARQWSVHSSEFYTAQSFCVGLGHTLLQLVDADGDGKITLDEWTTYLHKDLDIDFANVFLRLIDSNNDGQICLAELRTFYTLHKWDTSNLEERFQSIDLNQNGTISLEEMRKSCEHFMYAKTAELRRSWLFGT